MKKQNQNNPVVIGALLVVLLGAVVVIFRSFVPQTELTFTPAAAPAPPASLAAAPEAPGTLTVERDPFFHSDIRQVATADGRLAAPPGLPTGADAGMFSSPFDNSTGLSGTSPVSPTGKEKAKAVTKNRAPSAAKSPAPLDPALAENAWAQSLRLTAVLGGSRPRAIVESAGSQPAVVSVGEEIGILRVVAIRAQEIVLNGKSGFWTIPLQSAAPAETAVPSEPMAASDARPAAPGSPASKESNDEAGK